MSDGPSLQRFLLTAAAVILLMGALWWAREVIIPLVLGVLLSFVLAPAVTLLQRLGLTRIPSVMVVVLVALVLVSAVFVSLVNQITHLAEDLPRYQAHVAAKIAALQESTQSAWLDRLWQATGDIAQQLKGGNGAPADPKDPVLVEVRPPMFPLIQTAALSLLGFLVQTGLVVILVIFILSQREDLRNRLMRLWGHGNLAGMTKALNDLGERLSRYLMMQLLINVLFGAAVAGSLTLIGLVLTGEPFPYAFVAGILAGVLRYIPYLGAWMATVFPALVALAVYPQWSPLLWVLGVTLTLELILGNFLEPVLYGHSVGVSEVALLVAAAFWAWLWGPIGLVLAPPMTVCLTVAGRFVPQLEFLDILLSNRPALAPHFTFFQRLLARDHDEATDLAEDYLREHPERSVHDDVLAPALALAVRNQAQGQLSADEAHAVYQSMREVIDVMDRPKEPPETETSLATPVPVWGAPARDEADELVLLMLARMLPAHKCEFKIASSRTLASEFLEKVRHDRPALVCLGLTPLNRLAHARYLCVRLRGEFPALKILVVCASLQHDEEEVRARFKRAGADDVVYSLTQARDWLLPRLTVAQVNDSAA